MRSQWLISLLIAAVILPVGCGQSERERDRLQQEKAANILTEFASLVDECSSKVREIRDDAERITKVGEVFKEKHPGNDGLAGSAYTTIKATQRRLESLQYHAKVNEAWVAARSEVQRAEIAKELSPMLVYDVKQKLDQKFSA